MENTANNNNQVSGNASKISTDSNGLTGMVSNAATYDNTQIRDTNQFQHLISSDHVQLPPNPPFGMGHHFVTPFPGYMHAVPSGLYSLNMMEDSAEHHPKRRRRTNYRDPENAAKLTTALGILIKQKEENKPQDLKSIASHFGLPYNTLRDNYLKVTTGKLLKDKSDKKSDSETPRSHTPRARKSSSAGGASSSNSSRTSTPREPTTAASVMAQSLGTVPYGTTAVPAGSTGAPPFGAFQVYHPGMHFMPTMGMQPGGMQHMAAVQQQQPVPAGAMAAPGMAHPMMAGAPPMMHIFAASPMGFPVNPSTGRPFPMYASGGPGGETTAQGTAVCSSAESSSSVPATPHTPHMMAAPAGMYMGAMPPAAMPVFNPGAAAMYAPHMMDPATAAAMAAQQQQQQQQQHQQLQPVQLQPAQQQLQPTQQQPPPQSAAPTGFSLLLPGAAPGFAPSNGNVATTPSSNNAVFLAAAMNAAYADPQNNSTTNSNDNSANETSSVGVNAVVATSSVNGVEDSQASQQGQASEEEALTSGGNQSATVAVDPTENTSTTNGSGVVEEGVNAEGASGKESHEGSSDDSGTSAEATPTDSNENGQLTTKHATGVGNKHDRR